MVIFYELMKTYRISYNYQKLPVYIDSTLACKPKKSLFEIGEVLSVKICEEKSTEMKYISITTLFPKPKHMYSF